MREKHSESLAMSHRQNGDKGSSSSGGKQGRSRAGGSKNQWQLHRVADVMHKIYNNNSNNKHTDPAPKCCKQIYVHARRIPSLSLIPHSPPEIESGRSVHIDAGASSPN